MKTSQFIRNLLLAAFAVLLSGSLFAQKVQLGDIQYFRDFDKGGINVFEAPKANPSEYDGVKIRIGGSFTQQYQMLNHETGGFTVVDNVETPIQLYNLAPGFNLATANLYFAFQIEDGIQVLLENYMSSRHHSEFWVKGGYIQIDKLPMFGNPEWFTKAMRVKIGHFQPNYGDQQFRRTDNGNAIWNPFVGNYIADAFTTEIGGEVYVFPTDGLMLMAGLTAGYINGNIQAPPEATGNQEQQQRNPTLYLKAAYDKQVNDNLRLRLSASMTMNNNQNRNTLYGGDRTGSRYYLVQELAGASAGTNFTSGRWNPNFTNKLVAFQINPFVKLGGLEFFGTFENATGNNRFFGNGADSVDRSMTQLAGELIYRFLPNEQLFVGARYNSVSGNLIRASMDEQSINRMAFAAGWFPTRNLLLKVEYSTQSYGGDGEMEFPTSTKEYNGQWDGIVIEAVIGF